MPMLLKALLWVALLMPLIASSANETAQHRERSAIPSGLVHNAPGNLSADPHKDLREHLAPAIAVLTAQSFDLDQSLDAYARLPGTRALAVATSAAGAVWGSASNAPSPPVAAVRAIEECEQRRSLSVVQAPCELVRIGDSQIATGRAIQAGANATSPLPMWEVTHEEHRLWLVGSVHLMKPTLFPLPVEITQAWAESDTLVLELDTAGISEQALTERLLLPEEQTIRQVLPETLHETFSDRLLMYGVSYQPLERFKPAWLATQIQVNHLASLGYLPQHGLEARFTRLAKVHGRPVVALETIDEQLGALLDHPLSVQNALLAQSLDDMQSANELLRSILSAWWMGDMQAFLNFFKGSSDEYKELDSFNKMLLQDRNLRMADRITPMLNTPPIEFVLVGSAHMPGDDGIVALLRAAGFKIRQVRRGDAIH